MVLHKSNAAGASARLLTGLVISIWLYQVKSQDKFAIFNTRSALVSIVAANINQVLVDNDVNRCLSLWQRLNELMPDGSRLTKKGDGLTDIQDSVLTELKYWLEEKYLNRQGPGSSLFDELHFAYLTVAKCSFLVRMFHRDLLNRRVKPEKPTNLKQEIEKNRLRLQIEWTNLQSEQHEQMRDERKHITQRQNLIREKASEEERLAKLLESRNADRDHSKNIDYLQKEKELRAKLVSIDKQIEILGKLVRTSSSLKEEAESKKTDVMDAGLDRLPLHIQLANCQNRLYKQCRNLHDRIAKLELDLFVRKGLYDKCRHSLEQIMNVLAHI